MGYPAGMPRPARRWFALLLATLAACSSGSEPKDPSHDEVALAEPEPAPTGTAAAATDPPPEPAEPDPPNTERFEAVVRVSRPEGAEKRLVFRGVTLDRTDAPMVVASYSSSKVWDALDGRKVRALGDPYQPEGRAIGGQHMRILELSVVNPSPSDTVIGFRRAKTLEGKFDLKKGEPGTKSEGSTWSVFVSGGTSYEVFDAPESLAKDGANIEITARVVELSRTMARRGGPFLWVTGKASNEDED